jgi:hypothetical protein
MSRICHAGVMHAWRVTGCRLGEKTARSTADCAEPAGDVGAVGPARAVGGSGSLADCDGGRGWRPLSGGKALRRAGANGRLEAAAAGALGATPPG